MHSTMTKRQVDHRDCSTHNALSSNANDQRCIRTWGQSEGHEVGERGLMVFLRASKAYKTGDFVHINYELSSVHQGISDHGFVPASWAETVSSVMMSSQRHETDLESVPVEVTLELDTQGTRKVSSAHWRPAGKPLNSTSPSWEQLVYDWINGMCSDVWFQSLHVWRMECAKQSFSVLFTADACTEPVAQVETVEACNRRLVGLSSSPAFTSIRTTIDGQGEYNSRFEDADEESLPSLIGSPSSAINPYRRQLAEWVVNAEHALLQTVRDTLLQAQSHAV